MFAHHAGIYHWTPEGRRLFDFSLGVLVANLGHNPVRWMQRFCKYMGWPEPGQPIAASHPGVPAGYFAALPMNAYNGITPIEVHASRRLVELLQKSPGGKRLEQVMWAASGPRRSKKRFGPAGRAIAVGR